MSCGKPVAKIEQVIFGFMLFAATCAPFAKLLGADSNSPFVSNGFLVAFIGILLMLIFHCRELTVDSTSRWFYLFAMVGICSTLLMSFVLNGSMGKLFGQTTFDASFPSICWLVFDCLIVLYFSWALVKMPSQIIDTAFGILVCFVLVVSTLEVVFGETLSGILSNWIALYDSYTARGRICGVATEPSTMASVLGIVCLPYCYARFKNGYGKRYGFALLALLVVAFFTKSTTVYITVLFVIAGIVVRESSTWIKRNCGVLALSICSLGLACIAFVVIFAVSGSVLHNGFDDFNQVLARATSSTDDSGAYRNSTIINDWSILTEYPVFGVGDGNQGFFYERNLPTWIAMSTSTEVVDALHGAKGVLDGGAFIGSLVSGFGIVGTGLFIAWALALFGKARKHKANMGHFYDMYLISLCGAVPVLWINLGLKGAPVIVFFVFTMPYIGRRASRHCHMEEVG